MATATKQPKVQDMQARLAEARQRRDELQEEARRIQEVSAYSVDAPQVSRQERLRRKAREPAVRSELLEAQAEVEEREAELRQAKTEAKRTRQAEARRKLKERIPAIEQAATVLTALVHEAMPYGQVADPEALRPFAPLVGHGEQGEGLLSSAIRYWEDAGLLDEESRERAA